MDSHKKKKKQKWCVVDKLKKEMKNNKTVCSIPKKKNKNNNGPASRRNVFACSCLSTQSATFFFSCFKKKWRLTILLLFFAFSLPIYEEENKGPAVSCRVVLQYFIASVRVRIVLFYKFLIVYWKTPPHLMLRLFLSFPIHSSFSFFF